MLKHLLGPNVELSLLTGPELSLALADRNQMEQVLANLTLNAADAMPNGGRFIVETRNVSLGSDCIVIHPDVVPGDYVLLAATDTGIGMTPDTARRAFEPFFTTKEVGKGTGLGLATCHGVVKQAGGHISLYSEHGKGTTVKIYLPALPRGARAPAPLPVKAEMPAGTGTILVAEDEETVRALAARCLEKLGYGVLQAADGTEALLAAEGCAGRIDLLLSDVVMPGMSGKELAERLLRQRPETRIMFMSGYASGAVQTMEELPADALFLQKPFTPSALARRVRDALDAPRREQGSGSRSSSHDASGGPDLQRPDESDALSSR